MDKSSHVYILAREPYGTLYVGVTSDLIKRRYHAGHHTRKTDQEMEAGLEGQSHPENECRLA
jgi:predicted GIY-YIG superfamily endonuclease